jgi:hypothetical protein
LVPSSVTSGVVLFPLIFTTSGGSVPFVNAGAPGGLPILDSHGGINASQVGGVDANMVSGSVPVDIVSVNGTTFTGPNVPATAVTISDKTGYVLGPGGLDAVNPAEPVGPTSGWNFRQWMRWVAMNFSNVTVTNGTITVKTRAGAASTSQTASDDGQGNQSTGMPS